MTAAEVWLPMRGAEDIYSVSDCGRVRSEDRSIVRSDGVQQNLAGKLLTPTVSNPRSGHLVVHLQIGGKSRSVLVHRAVLSAFVGPCPPGMQGLHWDDDPSNNNLSNLRWGTSSDNVRDCVRNGNHLSARKTHCPQLHEYTPDNTLVSSGKRRCRACIRENAVAANQRKRVRYAAKRSATETKEFA